MSIREKIEKIEELTLIKEAALSKNSTGRERYEPLDETRTAYMVDRDRVIHCKSFRRLMHKTQVYIKTTGDHYRTRLTHTLEVSQIARTIAKAIGLNENLVEAIALGHDLGHVPFAHNGEEVLAKFLPNGFKHNEQSVRVVRFLEKEGRGLNLSNEVIDGILNHSGFSKSSKKAETLEGQIVKYSDKIAYVNHDIDDSIRAGLLTVQDLPKESISILGESHGKRIDTLVGDIVKTTVNNIEKGKNEVSLSPEIDEALYNLRNFMFKNIYNGAFLKEERDKAKFILCQVIDHYHKNPEKMPELYKEVVEREGLERGVADYIAGMSDDYCLVLFNKIFVPKFVIY
ncbi:MAG: deoxyguanosinetriphosphate triphosphohydrolase [Clostridiaceae bacterium]